MAMRLVRALAPILNGSVSVNVKARQCHLLGSTPTFSRRLCAQSVASSSSFASHSRKPYSVHLKLPPGREEELSRNEEEREKWYHSFISGGKRTGVGSDKDPRIKHARIYGYPVGFSAWLTRDEALALREYDGFVFARPNREIPFPYPRRPKNKIKKTTPDAHECIYASEEIRKEMTDGPRRRREYLMRMEKLRLDSDSKF